jgi:methylmalonyl-CoA/ethylmalonyl-CoA epimerase
MTTIDLFGEGAEFDHIGMSMDSITRGLGGIEQIVDPIQKVAVAFFQLHGLRIEAVEPRGEDSPVANQVKRGVKLLHLCYRVPDLEKSIQVARQNGLSLIASPVPAAGFDGRRIAWLFSGNMGLFELVELLRTSCPSDQTR